VQTNHFPRVLGLAAVVTLLQSCGGGPKSSSTSGPEGGPVPTSRMTIWLTVESSEPGIAVVRANLNDGDLFADSYRLDGGDYFRACLDGVCRNMADNDSIFAPDYIARLDYQPGVDYVVSLTRREAQSAPDSRVVLPPAFTIVTPANRQQVTNGDTVLVTWTPNGVPAHVELNYESDCTFLNGTHGFSAGDLSDDTNSDGQESVRIDPLVSFAHPNAVSPVSRCSIDLIVTHELQGRLDPAFHHGFARGIVSRRVSLDYVPH
jgi:hypothetical protein